LGLKAGLEGWRRRKPEANRKAEPASEVEGASWRQARSVGRKVDGKRKLEIGMKAEPGTAGGASCRQVRRQGWKVGGRRKLEAGWKAQPEG